MKVTDAFWEKRNLGVDTAEFEAEKNDSIEEIKRTLTENEKQYNVVKIPSGNFELNAELSKMGYVYAESVLKLVHSKKKPPVQDSVKRLMDRITYTEMAESDIDRLFKEIEKGIFHTDRIALDPYFSVDIANRRYINWIKDEAARGCKLLNLRYEGEVISFSAIKKLENNVYYPFLGGIYADYLNSGLAVPATIAAIQAVLDMKPSRVFTYVSDNNPMALMCNLLSGFYAKETHNVFIKHCL